MKKIFTLLFAIAASITMVQADMIYLVKIGDLYYNLDTENETAEVAQNWKYSGSIVIPSSVTYNNITYSVASIGNKAFETRTDLTSVEIPNSVTSIGSSAFEGCKSLTSVEIPNSVTSIGDKAFSYCTGLTSVAIPNSITSIGERTFDYCKSLTSIEIPNSVTSIGLHAFADCTGLTSVTIPNSVTSIGRYAFEGCKSLTSVEIPSSVTSIGEWVFSYCTGLTSINVDADNPSYCSEDGVLFNNEKTILIQYPIGKQGSYYIILNSVTSIGETAFANCTNLTSIEIPNSVISIGFQAFENCTRLTSVPIPNSVTMIDAYAFSGCKGLTAIVIPNSVTSIGHDAFSGCTGLTSVIIGNSVTSIGSSAFEGCKGLTAITCKAVNPPTMSYNVFGQVDKSIPLYVPAESIDAYKAADVNWREFTNILPIEKPIETKEEDVNIYYLDREKDELHSELVTFNVPVAPVIEGFTFLRWDVVAGTLAEGIYLQAVYTADVPTSAPAVYTNPANPAQKLIRNGNVYILTDDKTYTLIGQEVR